MALDLFESVSRTAGFLRLGEETVGRILDDDELGRRRARTRGSRSRCRHWVAARGALLGKVRFKSMDRGYLLAGSPGCDVIWHLAT